MFIRQLFCDHYWVEATDPRDHHGFAWKEFYRCTKCTKGKYFTYTPINYDTF